MKALNNMKETYYATVTSKGQITVPKAVRESLAVFTGDRIAFTLEDGNVAVAGISTNIEDLFGKFKPVPGADTSDWDKVRQEAWDDAIGDRFQRTTEE